jgi:HCOMODA/2-hydroxy-3-carboxy-muconic semialdehyde decarboxylase
MKFLWIAGWLRATLTISKHSLTSAGAAFIALATLTFAQSGSPPDQAAITDLVLANRILASDEVGIFQMRGHVSYRSRTDPSRFFIARNVAPGLVTARDIYESNLNGTVVEPRLTLAGSELYAERFVDAEIYKARPDVMAIVTAETPEFVAFSVSSVPMHGANAPPVVDVRTFTGGQSGLVSTPALGASLAQALGRRNAILLRGRGAVITAGTINGVVGLANGLRESMRTQLGAAALGGKITYLDFAPRPPGTAPQQAGRGGRANTPADPTAGDRPWNYWKYLANAELTREARGQAPAPAGPAVARSDEALIDDLVVASRVLSTTEAGILGAYGHVSVRSLANPNHYFISTDRSPGSITTADILENDLDSKAAVATDKSQFQEVFIHGEIYKARPDVMAVLHAHTPELVSFGLSSVPLRPVLLGGNFIGAGLPIYDIREYTGGYASPVGCAHCISTPELGRALAMVIGSRGASLLFGHGTAVVEASLPALVNRAYDMRMNAVIQQMALSLGGTVNYLEGSGSPAAPDPAVWEYWKRRVSSN